MVTLYEKEKLNKNTIDEQKPQMPVENFAKVNERMVDSIEISDMEAQKEGAPELKEETEEETLDKEEVKSDYFTFSDLNNETSSFNQPEDRMENNEGTKEVELEIPDYDDRLEIENQMADITSLINAGRDRVKELSTEKESYAY